MLSTKTLGTSTAVVLNVAYDNAYRSTNYDWKKSGNTVVGFSYAYDGAGNKRYEEKLHDTDKSQLYIYDGVYRLTNFKEGTLNEAKKDIPSPAYYQDWEHDGLGNWTKFYDNSGTPETRTHNNVNELTARDATNLTYDDNGNLSDDGTYTFAYDALNRLIKVTRKLDSAVMGEYAYDALGRRIWRKSDEDQSGGQETELYYVYDGNREIEERVYSDEDLKRDYVYGNYIDEPIFGRSDNNDDNDFADSKEQFYYTHNNLYNVAVLLDTSGNIIESYAYQPYGKPTIYTADGGDGDWFDGDETTGPLTGNYYLFTGRRYDPESGLYYFRARYHSPALGRFINRDPIFDVNLYWYCSDNPTNTLDPRGEFAIPCGWLTAIGGSARLCGPMGPTPLTICVGASLSGRAKRCCDATAGMRTQLDLILTIFAGVYPFETPGGHVSWQRPPYRGPVIAYTTGTKCTTKPWDLKGCIVVSIGKTFHRWSFIFGCRVCAPDFSVTCGRGIGSGTGIAGEARGYKSWVF